MTHGPHIIGALIALLILAAISSTLYWMLHPPKNIADQTATKAEQAVKDLIGSVIVVFSQEIHSEHMMSLAARLARGERSELLVAYLIEVPLTLPLDAELETENRAALGVLAVAESIARERKIEIKTEITPVRSVGQGVLELARRRAAHLIVLGSYREGKYTGAPLGRAIEIIAAGAECDVLIGVQGVQGTVLTQPIAQPTSAPA